MKKLIITVVAVVFMASSAYPAQMCIVIDDAKVAPIKASILKVKPNDERKMKVGVDPLGAEQAGRGDDNYWEDAYTDNQWIKELMRRYIRRMANAGRKAIQREAISPITYDEDITQ